MSHVFFLDESGNAGINYLDVNQPFHVAAGVLLASSKRFVFTAALRAQLAQSQHELKGTQLMRSASGQRRALAVLTEIGRHGGMPFFVVMERRFSLAGKIVDVLCSRTD